MDLLNMLYLTDEELAFAQAFNDHLEEGEKVIHKDSNGAILSAGDNVPKEWENAHVARVTEMVEATYNAPSVVIWSLGNEAGPGNNFKVVYDHLKTIDKSRPVQYERNNDIVDMGSNQYPSAL